MARPGADWERLGAVPLRSSYDVVIIGGAVVGSSVAYFLAAQTGFKGSILVVERDPTYAEAATARSVGGMRQQFSTPENIHMSRFGIRFVKSIGSWLSVNGEAPNVSFVENGYLFLASEAGLSILRQNLAVQAALGAPVALLSPAELALRFPWLNTSDLAGGTLGLSDEGWIDPYSLLQAFRRKARSLGVAYAKDEVVGLTRKAARITAVTLAEAGGVACGSVVNTAGARAAHIAALAGLDIPVRPRKRFVYVFDCRAEVKGAPLLVDPAGVYFRPEGHSFICGVSPPEAEDPDCLDLEVDHRLFEETVWPTLAHRVPAFEAIKLVNAWAGTYDYNVFDQNAILGPHPELGNFYLANGFSGHGLQQSPAVGRALAELIAHGQYRTLDLSRFSYERVLRNEPIRELNVV
jgi:FAD-dependent oxidoreductase domain-containing protein 1